LTLAATSAGLATITRTPGKVLGVVSASLATLPVRAVGRLFATTSPGGVTIQRALSRTLSAVSAQGTRTALQFAGGVTTDNVAVSGMTAVGTLSQMTTAGWLYIRSSGGGTGGRVLVRNGLAFQCFGTPDRLGYAQQTNGTNGLWTIDTSALLNRWIHVALTYDNSSLANVPVFYVNGVAVTVTTVATPTGTLASSANTPIVIGNTTSTGNRAFDGYLDNLALYGRLLSAAEILSLYQGVEPSTTSLQLRYRFDEGSGTTALDSGPNGYNGGITGATYVAGVYPLFLTRAVARTEAAASAAIGTLLRVPARTMTTVAASIATASRSPSRFLSAASGSLATVSRQLARTFSGSAASAAMVLRQVARSLSVSAIGTATVSRAFGHVLAAVAGTATNLTRSIGRTLAGNAATSALLARQSARTLAAVSSASDTVSRQMARSFKAVAASLTRLLNGNHPPLVEPLRMIGQAGLTRLAGLFGQTRVSGSTGKTDLVGVGGRTSDSGNSGRTRDG